jgi:glycerol kinase
MLQNTGKSAGTTHKPDNGRLDPQWRDGIRLEGSVFIGSAVVQWLRDGLGIIRSSGEVEALAWSVRTMVTCAWSPRSPGWRTALGSICAARRGVTRGATAAHRPGRARVDCVSIGDLLDAMQADAGVPVSELRVDGGAAKRFHDAIPIGCDRRARGQPQIAETTALEPRIRGIGVVSGSGDEIASRWRTERRFAVMPGAPVRAMRAGD